MYTDVSGKPRFNHSVETALQSAGILSFFQDIVFGSSEELYKQ